MTLVWYKVHLPHPSELLFYCSLPQPPLSRSFCPQCPRDADGVREGSGSGNSSHLLVFPLLGSGSLLCWLSLVICCCWLLFELDLGFNCPSAFGVEAKFSPQVRCPGLCLQGCFTLRRVGPSSVTGSNLPNLTPHWGPWEPSGSPSVVFRTLGLWVRGYHHLRVPRSLCLQVKSEFPPHWLGSGNEVKTWFSSCRSKWRRHCLSSIHLWINEWM